MQPDTAQLARQAPLRLSVPESVSIVGCGGVGSWLAIFLALAGVSKLTLWDSDTVSETNLNRLPLGPIYLGVGKAEALKQLLASLKPSCDVVSLFRWTPDAQTECGIPAEWIVAATDTWASRREVHQWALDHFVRYLECAAEGEFGSVTGAPATFATEDEANPGYASVPIHVAPCTLAASLAAYHILHSNGLGEAQWRIGWQDNTIVVQH